MTIGQRLHKPVAHRDLRAPTRAAETVVIAAPDLQSADPRPCSHPLAISPDDGDKAQASSSPNGAVSRQISST